MSALHRLWKTGRVVGSLLTLGSKQTPLHLNLECSSDIFMKHTVSNSVLSKYKEMS
jgi:hypothetical protein